MMDPFQIKNTKIKWWPFTILTYKVARNLFQYDVIMRVLFVRTPGTRIKKALPVQGRAYLKCNES